MRFLAKMCNHLVLHKKRKNLVSALYSAHGSGSQTSKGQALGTFWLDIAFKGKILAGHSTQPAGSPPGISITKCVVSPSSHWVIASHTG